MSALEKEVATALVQRGIPEAQALEIARSAAESRVLEQVEALVKSPGYRNPK